MNSPTFSCPAPRDACSAAHPIRLFLAGSSWPAMVSMARSLGKDPEIVIVGSAAEAEGVLHQVPNLHPDFVVVTPDLPGLRVDELARRLKRMRISPIVVVVAEAGDSVEAERLLAAGADMYLSPGGESSGTLRHAIRRRSELWSGWSPTSDVS